MGREVSCDIICLVRSYWSEGMKVKNQNKTKIGVGSDVNSKVGELENITR